MMTATNPSTYGTSTETNNDWRHEAACLAADPDLFFPIGDTGKPGPAQCQADEAKEWCARCPVVDACREWALARGESDGIWGGLTGSELSAERRRRSRRTRADHFVSAPAAPLISPAPHEQLVPAEDTLHMITLYRDSGKSWRQIGRLLGTADATCREVYRGQRRRVARATEDNARTLSELVHA